MDLTRVNDLITKRHRSKFFSTYLLSKELKLDVLPITDEGKEHFTSQIFA